MIKNLDELIAPISSVDFWENYYERDALYIPNHAQRCVGDIFSQEDADLILWQHKDKLQDFIRIGNQGKILFAKITGDSDITRDCVIDKHQKGWTLILDYLQEFSVPVARLQRSLEGDFGCDFDVSAFLTPKDSSGLSAHCDRTDVFILQIEGYKNWRLYGHVDPILGIDLANLGEPTQQICLQPGDVLYLPRGFIHQGETQKNFSLSLSIKPVNPTQWVDLLKGIFRIAAQTDVDLCSVVPMQQYQNISHQCLEELFSKLLKQIRKKDTLKRAISLCQKDLILNRPGMPDSHFERCVVSDNLQTDDLIERAAETVCHIYSTDDASDKVSICFPGSSVDNLPKQLKPALRFIANSTEAFSAHDLPGGLSDRTKLVLAKRLLREGLLRKINNGVSTGVRTSRP